MKTTNDVMGEAGRIGIMSVNKGFKPVEALTVLESARACTLSFLANDSQDIFKKAGKAPSY